MVCKLLKESISTNCYLIRTVNSVELTASFYFLCALSARVNDELGIVTCIKVFYGCNHCYQHAGPD